MACIQRSWSQPWLLIIEWCTSQVDVWEHGTEQANIKSYLRGRVFLFSTSSPHPWGADLSAHMALVREIRLQTYHNVNWYNSWHPVILLTFSTGQAVDKVYFSTQHYTHHTYVPSLPENKINFICKYFKAITSIKSYTLTRMVSSI